MSWYDDVKTLLDDSGYREIPENKNPEESPTSFNDKSYSLKNTGRDQFYYFTSNNVGWYNKALLEIKYKNIDSKERNSNQSLFNSLIIDLAAVDGFGGFNFVSFIDLDNKSTKGTIEFLIGFEGTC